MVLYVVRHGEAEDGSERVADEWRHLSVKGRKNSAIIAKAIADLGSKPRQIITSPLSRAVQTAEIAVAYACRKHNVETTALLLPGGEVAELVKYIKNCDDDGRVMLMTDFWRFGTVGSLNLRCSPRNALKYRALYVLQEI